MKNDYAIQVKWKKLERGLRQGRGVGAWSGTLWCGEKVIQNLYVESVYVGQLGSFYKGFHRHNWSHPKKFNSLSEAKELLLEQAVVSFLKRKGYSLRMSRDLLGHNGEEARKVAETLLTLDGVL